MNYSYSAKRHIETNVPDGERWIFNSDAGKKNFQRMVELPDSYGVFEIAKFYNLQRAFSAAAQKLNFYKEIL